MKRKRSPFHQGRFAFVIVVMIIFWALLQVTLFRYQVIHADVFKTFAKKQYNKDYPLKAPRGTIYDREGAKLATNIIYYDFAVDPKMVENPDALVRQLTAVGKRPASWYRKKLAAPGRFVYLTRRVPSFEARDWLRIQDRGFIKRKSFGRYYPFRSYAAPLIGFTDPDNKGLAGLELQYKDVLTGHDGLAVLQFDASRKRVFYDFDRPVIKPRPGNDLILTIDKDIQTVVENALERGLQRTRAQSAMAVVIQPYTGEILALANAPGFDPNRHAAASEAAKRNRVVTDAFEPGSTVKMFTAAALLQEGLMPPDTIVYCENGKYPLYQHVIRDSKKHGWLTFRKVIELSSNIGIVKLSKDLPSNTLFRYLRSFGFGQKTGAGMLGEVPGTLTQPSTWSGLSKASISFGQEMSVNALQITNAFAALVNGGYLYRPFVIRGVRDPQGHWIEKTDVQRIRQVISPEVGAILKSFMKGVVERGTGVKAALKDAVAGGKTGTAQKYDPKSRRYMAGKYVASFIGFAPYDTPRYVCGVFIDEPRVHYYGGDAAGPVFAEIMNQILHFRTDPVTPGLAAPVQGGLLATRLKSLPDMRGWRPESALAMLEDRDYDVETTSDTGRVRLVSIKEDDAVLELNDARPAERLPDLRGKSLRQALELINPGVLEVTVKGSGRVYKQSLAPGSKLTPGRSLKLFLK
ncbi:MAG: PASTA domain-containing protein [Calditrichaeota bacterium]|nr:MAG: PASTA domain-containing protein [Calditrichota bacterium]